MPPQKKPKKAVNKPSDPPKEESAPQVQNEEVPDDDLAPDADDRGDALPPELERYVTENAEDIQDQVDERDPRLPEEGDG